MAAVLAALCCIALLCSVCFIATQAEHECTGENCSICCVLQLCESVLRSFGIAVAVVALASLAGCRCALHIKERTQPFGFTTPVTLKVKLSN